MDDVPDSELEEHQRERRERKRNKWLEITATRDELLEANFDACVLG